MRRIWRRKVSVLVFLGGLLMLLRPLLVQLPDLSRYSFFELYMFAFAAGDFTPFAALFPSAVISTVFAEDYLSGTIRMAMIRTGRKRYARNRIISTIVLGGGMMALYVILVLIVGAIFAKSPDSAEGYAKTLTLWGRYDLALRYGGALMYAGKVLLAFLFGAVWGLFGLVVSVVTTNVYSTAIVPLGVYMALWYFLDMNPLNPIYLLRGDSTILPSIGFVFAVQLSAVAALSILSGFLMLRKL